MCFLCRLRGLRTRIDNKLVIHRCYGDGRDERNRDRTPCKRSLVGRVEQMMCFADDDRRNNDADDDHQRAGEDRIFDDLQHGEVV